MIDVFILTKEGRGFSDKGIQYIINVVKQIYPVQTEEINIKMGKFCYCSRVISIFYL